jgi:hypothetical protein
VVAVVVLGDDSEVSVRRIDVVVVAVELLLLWVRGLKVLRAKRQKTKRDKNCCFRCWWEVSRDHSDQIGALLKGPGLW